MTDFLLLTCEHGGNRVPAPWAHLFRGKRELLQSHRGYDAGSLALARATARRLKRPLYFATVTRLLVELNRSLGHPALLSSITRELPAEERRMLLSQYYFPYRNKVESAADTAVQSGFRVVHISFHTFTPMWNRQERRADVGLLYDPSRAGETAACARIRERILERRPTLIVRRNYPYLGAADGFTTALRKLWNDSAYVGIELEVNQRLYFGPRPAWRRTVGDIAASLAECFAAGPSKKPGPQR